MASYTNIWDSLVPSPPTQKGRKGTGSGEKGRTAVKIVRGQSDCGSVVT